MSDVINSVDTFLSWMQAYWNFVTSNFYTAILPTLGLVGIVYKLIKKVFR